MTKRFVFEVTEIDGMVSFRSEGEGFNTFEALGFMLWKIEDIHQQIRGEVKPDIVERRVIVTEATGGQHE